MALLTTRDTAGTGATVKGSELTWNELDYNFINLNTEVVLTTSYYVTGVLKVANGGTGAITAPLARVSLGLTTSTTGSMILPKGNTSQRDANNAGYIRFNTQTNEFEGNNGSAWASVGGSAISNDVATATNLYPVFAAATTGTAANIYTSNSKYLFKPSTGELSASEIIASNGIVVNNATISENYTIVAGNNAMSVGPVTIASGKAVTVTAGCRWVVL